MKALLLAAGKATRLGTLSQTTPKCLHKISGETLLDRIVRQLSEVGVQDFLINTHHLAHMVSKHLSKRKDSYRFTISHEPELLGTLGTLRSNLAFFEEQPGWVVHADNYIQGSLEPFLGAFESRSAKSWGGMLTFVTAEPTECGVVETDDCGLVTSFHEKVPNPPSSEASAATFLFDCRVFSLVESLPWSLHDISYDLLPRLVGRLTAVRHEGLVIDIGTPRGLEAARSLGTDEDSNQD